MKKQCKHCGDTIPKTKRGYVCTTCKNGLDRYNMTKLDMIELHESQNKKCKLCDKDVELFAKRSSNSGYIDHCHSTGKVRSILCHPCNTSLGYIERVLDLDKLKKYISPS
jgi:hypothetical protein